MEIVVYRNADTLLTFAHAKGSAKLYLITEPVGRDQILKLFNHLTGAFDVAGASDANCNFHFRYLPFRHSIIRSPQRRPKTTGTHALFRCPSPTETRLRWASISERTAFNGNTAREVVVSLVGEVYRNIEMYSDDEDIASKYKYSTVADDELRIWMSSGGGFVVKIER